jgi:hypothetical protein
MDDMQRRTRDRSRSDDLAERFDAVAPAMHEHRHAAFGGNAKHLDDFPESRPGRVLNTHADSKAASGDFVAQALLHTLYLFRGGWVIRGGPEGGTTSSWRMPARPRIAARAQGWLALVP